MLFLSARFFRQICLVIFPRVSDDLFVLSFYRIWITLVIIKIEKFQSLFLVFYGVQGKLSVASAVFLLSSFPSNQ